MEKSECKWIGRFYINLATGKALCILKDNHDYLQNLESSYTYLLTDGTMKRQEEMLDTDVRELVNQWCDIEQDDSLEICWMIILTKAEKLINLLLGNKNEEN
jgi:hypothetical protein